MYLLKGQINYKHNFRVSEFLLISNLWAKRAVHNNLDTPNYSVDQHYLYSMRMGRAAGEDASHDSLRQLTGGLVLFFHDLHPHTGCYFITLRNAQLLSFQKAQRSSGGSNPNSRARFTACIRL